MKKLLILLGLILTISTFAQDTLRIGVKESAPFAIKYDNGSWGGLAIDVTKAYLEDSSIPYKLVELQGITYDEIVNMVSRGDIDVFAGDMTITAERFDKVDFTQPYFVTKTAIATKIKDEPGALDGFLSWKFAKSMLVLLVFIFVAGFIMWIVEKEENDYFDKGPKGIFDGSYFVSATMTTVGYGDVAAKTELGKVLAFVLMWISLGMVGYLYGNITTALTVAELDDGINSIASLSKMKVGTIDGTASATFLKENDVKYINFYSAEEALDAMNDNELDAFVYDKPILQYLTGQDQYDGIVISNKEFEEQTYGFAFPKGSDMDDKLNSTILKRIRGDEWRDMMNKYNLN